MNQDLVTLNEVLNNGTSIYFYQEEKTEAWVAYGYSAYLLSQRKELKHLAGFSEHMQMPWACITKVDFRNIVRDNTKTIECKDGFYVLPTETKVDEEAYQNWVVSLK